MGCGGDVTPDLAAGVVVVVVVGNCAVMMLTRDATALPEAENIPIYSPKIIFKKFNSDDFDGLISQTNAALPSHSLAI